LTTPVSKPSLKKPPPVDEELELLLDELDEEELELLLEDELELLDEEELELLLEDELELLLELEELLLDVPSPAQAGAAKLPSWLPWKPKPVLWPGCKACQQQQFVNWYVEPLPARVTFQLLVTVTDSGKVTVTVQPLMAVVPLLVTFTST
jgi:hypothetical protein